MDEQYAVRQATLATLERYGLEKMAASPGLLSRLGSAATWAFKNHPSPGYGSGVAGTVKDVAHSTANLAREFAVGSPADVWQSFRRNAQRSGSHLKAYGDMLKDYYWAPHDPNASRWGRVSHNVLNRGLGMAATGFDVYQAVTGDPSQRFGDYAAAATGALLNPITGSMGWKLGPLAHVAVTNAARTLGHKLDPVTDPPLPLVQSAPRLAPHVRRALRAHNMLANGSTEDLGALIEGD